MNHAKQSPADNLMSFWRVLYGEGPGYFAVAAQGDGRPFEDRCFKWPDEADTALAWIREETAQRHNVWQSVALFTRPERKSEHAAPIRILYTDDKADWPEAPPSIVVQTSPGKVQGYWLLREPVPPERAKDLQARLVARVGGDPGAKDLARVLRVPRTVNRKPEYAADPPTVSIVSLDPGRVYDADELDKLLPKLPDAATRTRMTTEQVAALHAVRMTGEGRWEALRSLAGHELATTSKPVEEVLEYVHTFNVAWNDPPYAKEEVARLVHDLAAKEQAKPRRAQTPLVPVVVGLDEVEPETVEWLARPYLAMRKINVIFGHPDSGKTYVAVDLAARTTAGRVPFACADGLWRGQPGMVLYMTAEDTLGDTIRPRLDKLGGDPARFKSLTHAMDGRREKFINIDEDLEVIAKVLYDIRPRLFVLDPLNAFVGRRVDVYRSNQVRDIMRRLAWLVEETETCAVVIAHPSKGERDTVLNRMADSAAYGQAARSVLLAGEDPEERGQFILTHVKSNLVGKGPSLRYAINDYGLAWMGETETTAEEVLMPHHERSTAPEREDAEEFLRAALAAGPRPAVEVMTEAWKLGISKITLKRAKRRLGVGSDKTGVRGGWMWGLPGGVESDSL